MKEINVNINSFMDEFRSLYKWLYEYGNRAEISAAAREFDERIKASENFKKFVGEFVGYRGDFISSDREAAAFIGALDEFVTP